MVNKINLNKALITNHAKQSNNCKQNFILNTKNDFYIKYYSNIMWYFQSFSRRYTTEDSRGMVAMVSDVIAPLKGRDKVRFDGRHASAMDQNAVLVGEEDGGDARSDRFRTLDVVLDGVSNEHHKDTIR